MKQQSLPANWLSDYIGYRQDLNKAKVARLNEELKVYKGVIPRSGSGFVSRFRDVTKEVWPYFAQAVKDADVRVTTMAGQRYSTEFIKRMTPRVVEDIVLDYMVNEVRELRQESDYQPILDAYEVLLNLSCVRTCIRKDVSLHSIGEIFGVPSEHTEIFTNLVKQVPDAEAFHLSYFLGTVLPQPNADLLTQVFEGLTQHEKLVDDFAYRSGPTLQRLNKECFNAHMLSVTAP